TSGARSTRPPSAARTRVRTATSRSCPTGCARTAATTRAARSSRRRPRNSTNSPRPMIALDANGADNGAATVAQGGRESGVPVTIFGPAREIGPGDDVVDAPIAITNEDEPARAVRARDDASLVQAVRAVKDGRAHGVVSAGPTGALMAAATLHLKRMRGVHRPAAAVLLPVPGSPTLLIDSGANLDVRTEYLV